MDAITRMRSFIQVVDSGGFSAAAREMGRSKALVSKYISELEDELGVRLLNRTTRQVSLTEVGESYYKEASEILQRIDDLQTSVQSSHGGVRGRLRVSAPRSVGDGLLNRAMMEFLAENPEVSLDLRLEDRFVDLVDEGFDVVIRITDMEDSSLIARKIAPFRTVVCATPKVIETYGAPRVPADLGTRPCIIDTNIRIKHSWDFLQDGQKMSVVVRGRTEVNSALGGRDAALAGLGFVRVPLMFVAKDLAEGRLVSVLDQFEPNNRSVFAVYPHRRHLSGKVRAFVDFLVEWVAKRKKSGEAWPD